MNIHGLTPLEVYLFPMYQQSNNKQCINRLCISLCGLNIKIFARI